MRFFTKIQIRILVKKRTLKLYSYVGIKKQYTTSTGETWSRGTNFRLTFAVNVTRGSFFFRTRIKKQRDQERQRAFDDRHWSKKSLEEMVERDWRILREDFAISTKGKRF